MQVGQANYDETPLPASVFTGDVIETSVEYTPFSLEGKALSRRVQIRAMVFRAPFITAGECIVRKDDNGNTLWHTKQGSPVKEMTTRKPDVVEERLYYLCPVSQTGLLEIVHLPDNWKEIQKREREGVQAQTSESMAEQMAALNARLEENARRHQQEMEEVLASLKALGIKPEDLGTAAGGKGK